MKVAKDYVLKLGFVFKEILKAGPGVFFLSMEKSSSYDELMVIH